ARLTAVGDARARTVGAAVAPSGARISVTTNGDEITVRVEADAPLLPMLTVSGHAVAVKEPDGEGGEPADAPAAG
ncbi:TadE family type IV pilus minor pilin, partial [Gordonia sp. (in: high G+C Gram-positive bacteria)]|uniref:TadE family type IV pilus minor pilin n=1 Tax=Gordonia sp. (in: high G+C Gram-positive bacteria) TaxID=84139 RepID=UPI0039E696AB